LPLSESTRREYLEALGIDSYLPRVQLPGAPLSPLARFSMSAAESGQVLESQADPEVKAPEVKTKAAPVVDAPARPAPKGTPGGSKTAVPTADTGLRKVEAKPAANDQPAEKAAVPHEVPREMPREEVKLQLLCIRVGKGEKGAAVIVAMPHLGPSHLGTGHQALLANLLRACGLAAGDMEIEDKPFRWPMVTGLHVDNSRRAAASALMAYLQQKRADWQFSNLLVMGETVISGLFAADPEKDDDRAQVKHLDQGDWHVIYTRSLDELLQRPTLKKEAWLQLRKGFSGN